MIYLDYNATTPLCDAAREAMLPYLNRLFGNPSSVHAAGREARAAIDDARDKIAALLHAKPGEIIFSSGATESCLPWLLLSPQRQPKRGNVCRRIKWQKLPGAIRLLSRRRASCSLPSGKQEK